jgi:hypothetical protein
VTEAEMVLYAREFARRRRFAEQMCVQESVDRHTIDVNGKSKSFADPRVNIDQKS